jgi:hypothetical protein
MDNILDPYFQRQVTHQHCKVIIIGHLATDDGLTSQEFAKLVSVAS